MPQRTTRKLRYQISTNKVADKTSSGKTQWNQRENFLSFEIPKNVKMFSPHLNPRVSMKHPAKTRLDLNKYGKEDGPVVFLKEHYFSNPNSAKRHIKKNKLKPFPKIESDRPKNERFWE